MTKHFEQIVVVDFEYETQGGEFNLVAGDLPKVLCMVAYVLNRNLEHVRTIRQWRGEFGSSPPFDLGPDTLFVAYAAWADLTCFLTLDWKFPTHVFDLHTAYLAATNILLPYNPDEKRTRERKRLPDACRRYNIPGWENIDKEEISKDIGQGRWRLHGQDRVFEYCEEDVRASTLLLKRQLIGNGGLLKPADPELVIYWSEYSAKAIARIQACGTPIDIVLWNLIQENMDAIIRELLRRFDPSYGSENPIYDADGSSSYERIEQWLYRTGVTEWPRLESGALDLSGDAFQLMSHVPGAEGLHALRKTIGFLTRANMPIGRDGRNRPSLFPFGTVTGRNAHSKSIFNAHSGLRSLIVFPRDKVGVYLDFRSQEIGVAAARSGDPKLKRDYESGDVYHALAAMCGLTDLPVDTWKRTHPDDRQRMKALQLAINYGMSVRSLARGLDRHSMIACEIIERHKRRYTPFWGWRDGNVETAMLNREIRSAHGWPMRISHSPNRRTLFNFPMQAVSADMLRLATVNLCNAGLVPVMTAHDAVLLELDNDGQIEIAKRIMIEASREVCDGFTIDVDADQILKNGARYRDKRDVARQMWSTIVTTLQDIGAWKKDLAA